MVQKPLRHASSKTTTDVYAQARMTDKRRSQLRIVKGLRRGEVVKKRNAKKTPKAGSQLVAKRSV